MLEPTWNERFEKFYLLAWSKILSNYRSEMSESKSWRGTRGRPYPFYGTSRHWLSETQIQVLGKLGGPWLTIKGRWNMLTRSAACTRVALFTIEWCIPYISLGDGRKSSYQGRSWSPVTGKRKPQKMSLTCRYRGCAESWYRGAFGWATPELFPSGALGSLSYTEYTCS